jgi:hypothetical protein
MISSVAKVTLAIIGISFAACSRQKSVLDSIPGTIVFRGDENTAYRDPAVLFHDGGFHLFFTLVEIEPDGSIFSYTATSQSRNLIDWTPIRKITPRDQSLNYCSPGNVIRHKGEWILCLQSYPRESYKRDQMPRYGSEAARVYLMRSKNLSDWSNPELMHLKGDDVAVESMGRMIDAYLVEDKDVSGKWWCFFDTNAVNRSYSFDLKEWVYDGKIEGGENACVLVENDAYVLFHSPKNGIGIKRSDHLKNWRDWGGLITLGQEDWDWAKGRLSAGAVVDLRGNPDFGKYIMFFHGSGPHPERGATPEESDFDKNASIGIAWSDDLLNWEWPEMEND